MSIPSPSYRSPPLNPDTRPLPDGWVSKYSISLQTWGYLNTKSSPQYHSWVHPSDPQPINPDTRRLPGGWYSAYDPSSERWAYVNTNVTPHTHSLLHPLDPQPRNPDTRPLPPGWYSAYDPVPNQWLYVNTAGEAGPSSHVWSHPLDIPPPNKDIRPLPDGWVSKYDPGTKQWFYVDTTIIPHHWTWDHPQGPFSPRSPLPDKTIIIVKLANFLKDHHISPVNDPAAWLEANRTQVLSILRDFDGTNSQDYSRIFRANTMFPRFLAYIIMELSGKARHALFNLIEREHGQWASAENIERLTNWRSVIRTLWGYGTSCVSLEHGETCEIIVELLDLDVKGLCAQLMCLKAALGERNFFSQPRRSTQRLVDFLQAILDYPRLDPLIRPWIIPMVARLAQKSGLYPTSLVVRGLRRDAHLPFAGGSYGDVFQGHANCHKVAIKVLKVYQTTDLKTLLTNFSREVVVWRQLSHPNVLPFCGVFHWNGERSRVCLVSPWTDNGNVVQFLENTPDADRGWLVHDIAHGLEYLHAHKPPIVHGDIKGDNILITSTRRACLADFGLSWAVDPRANPTASRLYPGMGALRWQAPEVLREDTEHPTEDDLVQGDYALASDIYSLGCAAYEIFAGNLPFYEIRNNYIVMREVLAGKRPTRPRHAPGLDDAIWNIIECCWKEKPNERLTATQVVELISSHPSQKAYTAAHPWDDSFTSPLRSDLGVYPSNAKQLISACALLPRRHRPTAGPQGL